MKKSIANESRYHWQREAETYFNNLPHPKQWFEFLGWITAFSTLNFLSQQTGSIYIKVLYWISFFVLYNYIERKLWTKRFQDYLPESLSDKTRLVITYSISALTIALAYHLGEKIVKDVINGLKLQ